MKKLHNIKIEQKYAIAVENDRKTFEIRYNDRDYKEGDLIGFICPDFPIIEGQIFKIIYITDYEQKEGWVVFGIKELK